MIHLIGTLKGGEADKLVEGLSAGQIPENYEEMLAGSGSLEYSRKVVMDFCNKATGFLESIDGGEDKEMLADIVRIVIERAISNKQ